MLQSIFPDKKPVSIKAFENGSQRKASLRPDMQIIRETDGEPKLTKELKSFVARKLENAIDR